MKNWRVSTDKGFQLINAPSHKAAAKLAEGKVLRIRSVKTPLQLHLRGVVQTKRRVLTAAKAELAALNAQFKDESKKYTKSQIESADGQAFLAKWDQRFQNQANKIQEAKDELRSRTKPKEAST